eukprot:7104877-Ditylum_brightwellii.AAC.1
MVGGKAVIDYLLSRKGPTILQVHTYPFNEHSPTDPEHQCRHKDKKMLTIAVDSEEGDISISDAINLAIYEEMLHSPTTTIHTKYLQAGSSLMTVTSLAMPKGGGSGWKLHF